MRFVFSLIVSIILLCPAASSAQTWKLVSPGGGGGSSGGVDCPLPWGGTLNHGDQITLYKDNAHPQCASIARPFACSNGMLVGYGDPYQDFRHESCIVVSIGDAVSAKGSAIYIGHLGENHLYMSPSDDSTSVKWKADNNAGTPGTQSLIDGYANTYNMNNNTYPAATLCASKSPAGTWYLPARDELNVIWENRTNINLSAKAISTSTTQYYWSSTEHGTNHAWGQQFGSGYQYDGFNKSDNNFRVRCFRR